MDQWSERCWAQCNSLQLIDKFWSRLQCPEQNNEWMFAAESHCRTGRWGHSGVWKIIKEKQRIRGDDDGQITVPKQKQVSFSLYLLAMRSTHVISLHALLTCFYVRINIHVLCHPLITTKSATFHLFLPFSLTLYISYNLVHLSHIRCTYTIKTCPRWMHWHTLCCSFKWGKYIDRRKQI